MAESLDSLSGRGGFAHFVQYLIAVCRRLEAASDVISGRLAGPVALDKHVKFHDPSLNRSREIPPDAVGGGIFIFFPYGFRPGVENDAISSVAVWL